MPFSATAKYPGAVAGVADLLNQKNKVPSQNSPTLASGITSSSTSISVSSGQGSVFPSDNFVISIDDEIIFISSRSSDILTVGTIGRGYEGTTAVSHSIGATVEARITAIAHNQIAAEINAIETVLGTNPGQAVGARVYKSTSTSVGDRTPVPISFDTQRFNYSNVYSLPYPTRLTAPVTGVYIIAGNISWAGGVADGTQAYLLLNGSTIIASVNGKGVEIDQDVATVWFLNENDYVELVAFSYTGGTETVDSVADYSPEFAMYLLPTGGAGPVGPAGPAGPAGAEGPIGVGVSATYIQSCGSAWGSTESCAFATANQAGNTLFAIIASGASGFSVNFGAPTDSQGNLYTYLGHYNSGVGAQIQVWAAFGCKAGANTVSGEVGSGIGYCIAAAEYNGTMSPCEQWETALGGLPAVSVTTTNPKDFLISFSSLCQYAAHPVITSATTTDTAAVARILAGSYIAVTERSVVAVGTYTESVALNGTNPVSLVKAAVWLSAGVQGNTGSTGPQGDKGGLRYQFDSTTSAGITNNGSLRFDNATIGSVANLFINVLDVNGVNFASFISHWADSTGTIKGYVLIKENSNAGTPFCIFSVNSVTNNTTYYTVTVAYVAGTIPTNLDALVMEWIRAGDIGATGPTGPTGSGTQELFTRAFYSNGAAATQRQFGTVYQNTSGYGKIVFGSYTNGASSTVLSCYVASASAGLVAAGNMVASSSAAGGYYGVFSFCVPNNYYYEVTSSGTAPTNEMWGEMTCSGCATNSGAITMSADLGGTLATPYHNTATTAKFVAVVLTGGGTIPVVTVACDSASNPATAVFVAASPTVSGVVTVWFLVPAGYYYQFTATNAPAVTHRYEWTMPFNGVQSADLLAAPQSRWSISTIAVISDPTYVNNQRYDLFVSVTCTPTSLSNIYSMWGSVINLNSGRETHKFYRVECAANAPQVGLAWPMLGEFYTIGGDAANALTHWFEYQLS